MQLGTYSGFRTFLGSTEWPASHSRRDQFAGLDMAVLKRPRHLKEVQVGIHH